MGHPSLKIDTSKLKDLLDDKRFLVISDKYIEYINGRIPVWLQNVLEKNSTEWTTLTDKMPTRDLDGYYESKMPNDIISIVTQEVI